MRTDRWTRSSLAAALAPLISLACGSPHASAASVTECTALNLCYCVNSDLKPTIDANVARVRALLAGQRQQGKAVGYMSIPLSTVGGGYFGVNRELAQKTKAHIESRFGAGSAFVLNPGAEGNLPGNASGA